MVGCLNGGLETRPTFHSRNGGNQVESAVYTHNSQELIKVGAMADEFCR